jgi:hypothetical protein
MEFSAKSWHYEMFIAHRAAQWGADVELQACCEWVSGYCPRWPDGSKPEDGLRAARRPNPYNLKEQALKSLTDLEPPADGEVAELVAWLRDRADSTSLAHAARRIIRVADLLECLAVPEPVQERDEPSLKEQALARLASLEKLAEAMGHNPNDTIRRALEQLND